MLLRVSKAPPGNLRAPPHAALRWPTFVLRLRVEPLRASHESAVLPDFASGPESAVLELINLDAPLEQVLVQLCVGLEARMPGMLAAVMLTDHSGARLRVGAAPNLPPACHEILNGCPISADSLPCGVAAYRRELLVVSDLLKDLQWARYRETALSHGSSPRSVLRVLPRSPRARGRRAPGRQDRLSARTHRHRTPDSRESPPRGGRAIPHHGGSGHPRDFPHHS